MKPLPLFTYGTLQFPSLMLAITSNRFRSESAQLDGYASYLVCGKSYPALLPDTTASTPGIIYHHIDRRSLRRLDAYEGNNYQKNQLPVTLQSGKKITALVYTAHPSFYHRVSQQYWDINQFETRWLNIYLRKCGLRSSHSLHA